MTRILFRIVATAVAIFFGCVAWLALSRRDLIGTGVCLGLSSIWAYWGWKEVLE